MIPKIIHYCWLSGDDYPPLVAKCIASWKEKLPDYEIILWDTNKIDIQSNKWLEQAFSVKKYAFASDYIRFYALYNYGGIYLDADVEVLKSFDDLLQRQYFIGEEAGGDIEAAVIGVEKGATWLKEGLSYYNDRNFIKPEGSFDMRPVPLLFNKIVQKYNMEILPYQYFSPKNYWNKKFDIDSNTYCIHHFDGKWVGEGVANKIKQNLHKILLLLLGRKLHNKLVKRIRKIFST